MSGVWYEELKPSASPGETGKSVAENNEETKQGAYSDGACFLHPFFNKYLLSVYCEARLTLQMIQIRVKYCPSFKELIIYCL